MNFRKAFTQTFEAVQNALPVVMKDDEGSLWDVFGNAVCGPMAGGSLKPTLSLMGYWFAWAPFFREKRIVNWPSGACI